MSNQEAPLAGTFIETKEYRRFAEFCDACCRYHYIGLCYGPPGVGKTLGARHYAEWDVLEPLWLHYITDRSRPKEIVDCRTVLYTPPVVNTPRAIDKELERLQHMLCTLVEEAILVHQAKPSQMRIADPLPNLVIVDEADRLKMTSLEHLYVIYNLERSGRLLNNIHYQGVRPLDVFAHVEPDKTYREPERADDAHLVTAEQRCLRAHRA